MYVQSPVSKKELLELKKIVNEAIKNYTTKDKKISDKTWLKAYLQQNKPDLDESEVIELTERIFIEFERIEINKKNIQKYNDNGLSSKQYMSSMESGYEQFISNKSNVEYLDSLNNVIEFSNESVINKIINKDGNINQNPNLDGFIAEYEHVNNFNIQSAVKGHGNIEAKVLEPEQGKTHAKNSMDVGIYENGKLVQRYQMKFGKTSEATIQMISAGDYSNQRLVVPDEQLDDIKKAFPNKSVISEIEYKSIKSKSLSKGEMKELQKKIQNGDLEIIEKNWSDINKKNLIISLSKNAAQASILGLGLSFTSSIVSDLFNDEKTDVNEKVEKAIRSGATSGVNVAVTGALTVAIKNEVIQLLPKETSITTIANISHIAIENVKILFKIGTGELCINDGINKIGDNTISTLGGIASAFTIGAWIGTLTLTGPALITATVIGNTVAYNAGKNIISAVYKGVASVVRGVTNVVWNGVQSVASKIRSAAGSFVSTITFGIFGW